MKSVFTVNSFEFPYTNLKFPGQATDEKILYIGREASVMLWLRLGSVAVVGGVIIAIMLLLPLFAGVLSSLMLALSTVGIVFSLVFVVVAMWWVYALWKKSLYVVTTRRLSKFIYSTPWNRYNLSVGLDKIVDTGAYTKGYFQALTGIGTFTARSSAGNRKEKYFYIENVQAYEDLANYVNKLLHAYNHNFEKLETFRPFIPFLKGEARKRYMKEFPQYWS